MAKGDGAWVPWEIATRLPQMNLRPQSRWQVFLAVLMTWLRYGRTEAKLSIQDICRITGLSARTVKVSLGDLESCGLVRRVGRYKRLIIVVDAMPEVASASPSVPHEGLTPESAGTMDESVAPACQPACCTFPISCEVFLARLDRGSTPFSTKQMGVIRDLMRESAELLGGNPFGLRLKGKFSRQLGLPDDATYGEALNTVLTSGVSGQARKFVAAVLALRRDARVQGQELGEVSRFDSQRG